MCSEPNTQPQNWQQVMLFVLQRVNADKHMEFNFVQK
jgi:hypothetical protein